MLHYTISLFLILLFFISGLIFLNKLEKYKKQINIIIPIIIFLFYLHGVIWMYISVGIKDWNFTNTLPVANVSPFMYTLIFVNLFLPKFIKKYNYTLISLLSIGMLVAGILICIGYVLRDYKFHLGIAMDSFNHILVALYGIYLVKSKQTFTNKKNIIVSGLIIIGVALIMLILNLIFDSFENGVTIKLPQEHMERAWEKFVKINNQYGLLNRKLTFIDLRYKDKVSVALSGTEDN